MAEQEHNKASPFLSPHWIMTAIEKFGVFAVLLTVIVYLLIFKNENLEIRLSAQQLSIVQGLKDDVTELKSTVKVSQESTRICQERVNALLTKTISESNKSIDKLTETITTLSVQVKKSRRY